MVLSVTAIAPAQAYLDPGTGSIILQLILGGVAGVMVVMKLYWHRLLSFFGRGDSSSDADE
ncbi:MAG: hypothetical protein E2O92_09620 [Alphaproteobacteria bacterium]|nr:MAG: hypothetical protein E2O92_09620 [Alphaproteobacteria bacterium]